MVYASQSDPCGGRSPRTAPDPWAGAAPGAPPGSQRPPPAAPAPHMETPPQQRHLLRN